jgi:SagB-type dehydrogenase family enzyme
MPPPVCRVRGRGERRSVIAPWWIVAVMSRTRLWLVRGTGSLLALAAATQGCLSASTTSSTQPPTSPLSTVLSLPSPATAGSLSLEEALAGRRSVREFTSQPLSWAHIGQLLWAAQGVTDAEGRRTAPSAGGLYPLDLYAVTAEATWRYLPEQHALERVHERDLRPELRAAALDQDAVAAAPLVVVMVAVPARTAGRYGQERAIRYAQLEAGHAAQNLLLEAVALELASVPVGAFDDARIGSTLGLPAGQTPLYLLPVGYPAAAQRSAEPT